MAGPTRYRQLQGPVGVELQNMDTGGAQAAMALSDAFKKFSDTAINIGAANRAEQGAAEGAAAGVSETPQPRHGFRGQTAYGQAYNSAAEAAYASKIAVDIDSSVTEFEQNNEANLGGYDKVANEYADVLLQEAPPEYRPRVELALKSRIAAGFERVRGQQIAQEHEENIAAYAAGVPASINLVVAGAEHLPQEQGDAMIAAAVADNDEKLKVLFPHDPIKAQELSAAYKKSLDKGLFDSQTTDEVDKLMAIAGADIVKGDAALVMEMNSPAWSDEQKAAIREGYDKRRTDLAEDRSRLLVDQAGALSKRLAGGDFGSGVEGASRALLSKGGITRAEHISNLDQSARNAKAHADDAIDVSGVELSMTGGPGLDPTNKDHIKAVDKYVEQRMAAENMQIGDERWEKMMGDVVHNTSILPSVADAYARQQMLHGDALGAVRAAQFYGRMEEANQNAWDYAVDKRIAPFAEMINASTSANVDPMRAYEMARTSVFEMKDDQKKVLAATYAANPKQIAENWDALQSDLDSDPHFDQSFWRGSPDAISAMKGEYDTLVGQYYVSMGGDLALARKAASKNVRSTYGVMTVNGAPEIVKMAPSRMYPGMSDDFIRKDILSQLEKAGLSDDVARDAAGFPIDLRRPVVHNPDGSFSTESTITIGADGRYYNIPTVIGGKRVSEDVAIQDARNQMKFGAQYPNFKTEEEALRQAAARSELIDALRKPLRQDTPENVNPESKVAMSAAAQREKQNAEHGAPPLSQQVQLMYYSGTGRSRGIKWQLGIRNEDGGADVMLGPDNQPLIYSLPVGAPFDKYKKDQADAQFLQAEELKKRAKKADEIRNSYILDRFDSGYRE